LATPWIACARCRRQSSDGENSDELGGLEATREIDDRLKRRSKDDHHTIRYDRGGGHFLFVKKDYWWDDLKTFLNEKLKRLEK
jgi:hypothetical protein